MLIALVIILATEVNCLIGPGRRRGEALPVRSAHHGKEMVFRGHAYGGGSQYFSMAIFGKQKP